jgi:hypothetical protein
MDPITSANSLKIKLNTLHRVLTRKRCYSSGVKYKNALYLDKKNYSGNMGRNWRDKASLEKMIENDYI